MRYFRVREVYHNKADPFVFPLREARDEITRAGKDPEAGTPHGVADDGEGNSKDIDLTPSDGHVADAPTARPPGPPVEQGAI